MENKHSNLFVIAGPTAVGKTALSLNLAKLLNCSNDIVTKSEYVMLVSTIVFLPVTSRNIPRVVLPISFILLPLTRTLVPERSGALPSYNSKYSMSLYGLGIKYFASCGVKVPSYVPVRS